MTFAEQWKKAGEPRDDFDPPNGSYVVKVIDTGAFAGKDGREWAKVVLEIVGGDHAGRQFDHFHNLNNEVGLRMAYEAFSMYGMKGDGIESLEDLDSALFDVRGTVANITVSHKDSYLNVRVQGSRTDKSDVTPATPEPQQQQSFAAAAAAGAGEDIPF